MTNTLIQRLRHFCGDMELADTYGDAMVEAADALEQQAAQIAEKDAEIARLTAELEALKGDLDPLFKDLADYGDENDRLRADAERYRWLRDNNRGSWAICEWSYDEPEGYYKDARAPGIVDAAIDAALRQEQPHG